MGCDEEEREEEEDDEEEDDDDLMLGEREADEVERMLVSVVLGLLGNSADFSSTSSTGWWGSMWFGVDSSISTSLSLVVDSFRSTDIVWFRVVSG